MGKSIMLIAVAMLAGCAASGRIVVLQNPETKQTVDCQVDGTVSRPYLKQENCISTYQKAGYRLVADSAAN